MSFDVERMRALVSAGPVVRVVVAGTRGSVPREAGASLIVRDGRMEGTIGGGALEFEAIARAREVLAGGPDRLDRVPLGPGLGQCCGGAVSVLIERWDEARLAAISGEVAARPLPGTAGPMPLSVERIVARARSEGAAPDAAMIEGWMVEPVTRPEREIWIWGAGHVGRAIVGLLAPLPGLSLHWADSGADRFPPVVPEGVDRLIAMNPADLVTLCGPDAEHLVLTYSHALDLELCHRILSRPFRSAGLIGSATKWARFRSRLAALGHGEAQIARILCPIGDPRLGKHPQAIALGVATGILAEGTRGMAMGTAGSLGA